MKEILDIAEGHGGITQEQRSRLAERVASDPNMSPDVRAAVRVALRPHEWVDLGRPPEEAATDQPILVMGLRLRPRHGMILEPGADAKPVELFFRSTRGPTRTVITDELVRLGLLPADYRSPVQALAAEAQRGAPDPGMPSLAIYRGSMTFGQLLGEGVRFKEPILLVPTEFLTVHSEAKLRDGEAWVAQMLVVASPLMAFHVKRALWPGAHDDPTPATTPKEAVENIRFHPGAANERWEILERAPV